MVPSTNFWQYRYKGILRCNIAVERISQADFSDEEMKNRLVAEARFLRGYFYFELVKNFGGVPLIHRLPVARRNYKVLPALRPKMYISSLKMI